MNPPRQPLSPEAERGVEWGIRRDRQRDGPIRTILARNLNNQVTNKKTAAALGHLCPGLGRLLKFSFDRNAPRRRAQGVPPTGQPAIRPPPPRRRRACAGRPASPASCHHSGSAPQPPPPRYRSCRSSDRGLAPRAASPVGL